MSTPEKHSDQVQSFLFAEQPVRGVMTRITEAWQQIAAAHDYPAGVRSLLGEAVAACALFTAHLKFEGRLSVQLSGDGPIHQLYAECTDKGELRATAQFNREGAERLDFDSLRGGGHLAITIEPVKGSQRYQGLVPLEGDSLGAALESYFERSEQLATRLWLVSSPTCIAGLMLQRIPDNSREQRQAEGWEHVLALAETVTVREMLELPHSELMHRLFHEEDRRVFDPLTLRFRCRCSREKVANVLLMMGEEEAYASLDGDCVESRCEFCGNEYRFDRIDLEQLFRDDRTS